MVKNDRIEFQTSKLFTDNCFQLNFNQFHYLSHNHTFVLQNINRNFYSQTIKVLVYNSILKLKTNSDGSQTMVNITKEFPKFPFIAGHFLINIEHCKVKNVILPRI